MGWERDGILNGTDTQEKLPGFRGGGAGGGCVAPTPLKSACMRRLSTVDMEER